jgi:PAS domain S-box-containing protein
MLVSTFCFAAGPADTTLVFLGNRNIPPVVFLEDSIPSGVAVDIVRALAKHMSERIEIRATDWQAAQGQVLGGEADALIQINRTDEREKLYDFSEPLLESQFSIFVRTDRVGISGITSLRGLHVGVESGGLPRLLLEKNPNIDVTIIPTFLEGFSRINAGTLDAIVVDYRVGSYVLAENRIKNIGVSGEPIALSYSALAVRKGNTRLLASINAGLRAIRSDGTYQSIIDKWSPTEVVLHTREQITAIITTVVMIVGVTLLLLVALWIVTLQRELRRRKEAEEKLAREHSILRGIIDSANAIVFSLDHKYRYTSFNAAYAESMRAMYGVDIAVGRAIAECMTVPEDREKALKNISRALAGETIEEESFSGDTALSRQFFKVSHSPIVRNGEVIGVAVLAQNLTELKMTHLALSQREREYRTVVENIPDLIVRYDTSLHRIYANPAWERARGLSAEDVINAPVDIDADPANAPIVREFLQKVHAARHSGQRETMEFSWHKNGSNSLFLSYVIVPEVDQEGAVASILAVGHDITERRRAEEALRTLNEELDRRVADRTHQLVSANKELEAFSYSVSHDLRAPLRGIDGFSHSLLDDYHQVLDERGRDYLRRIRSATAHMAQLIDDMLSLSRVTRREIVWGRVDISALAADVVHVLRALEPLRVVDISIEEGVTVWGDSQLLRVVLENLLGNAWKFTSRHASARIDVSMVRRDGRTVVVVRDDGAGFGMEYVHKLFGAFQRLHTAEEFPGTGIGLATVQRIIRRHGGEVWAEGEPEKGARFYFSLPERANGRAADREP